MRRNAIEQTVMVFGTFDILHPGHQDFFRQAKEYGNELIIIVARDQNVQKQKGETPQSSEEKRRMNVQKSEPTTTVLLGSIQNFYDPIKKHTPQVIALGYDQSANEKEIQSQFPLIKIIRLQPFFPKKYKSSLLKT